MNEQRDPELSPSSSSVKPLMAVAAALVGLLVLVCGGAAGYVALTAPSSSKAQAPIGGDGVGPTIGEHPLNTQLQMQLQTAMTTEVIPFTDDPAIVRKIAAVIVDIDLPANFEPIEAQQNSSTRVAVFGNKTEKEALLKLAGFEWPSSDHEGTTPADDALGRQVLQLAEDDNGRTDTTLRATRQKLKTVQRELTVLGQKATFQFRQGKRAADKKPVWKIWGVFRIATGMAALIYLVPESEFDEEAVVRMIESIRPAPDKKPETDEKSLPWKSTR